MKAFIVTEGGSKIGFGHITRCIPIYDCLIKRGVTPAFIINSDSAVTELVNGKAYKIFDWLKHGDRLFDALCGADIVIVDSYLAGASFYKRLSQMSKVPVYLDDYKRLNYPAGVIINGSIGAEKIAYPGKKDVTYLLGSDYALLRKEFWNVPEKIISGSIKSIMITFGGDDLTGMTPRVLSFLNKRYPTAEKNVIIGKGFDGANVKAVERFKDKNVKFIYQPSARKMKEIMMRADAAISAGGQTLGELASTGTPTIAVCIADNQLLNIKSWEKTGFIKYAGRYNQKDILNNIADSLKHLNTASVRQEMSKAGSGIIDGKGALRVVKYLMARRQADTVSIRMADFKDAADLMRLSNDSSVRANSYSPGRIGWQEHIAWLRRRLENKNCMLLVAEKDGTFCGQLRFDIDPKEKDAVINISLCKKMRGRGIAPFIINKSIGMLAQRRDDIKTVKAYVKEGNVPSLISFKRADFRFVKDTVVKGNKSKVFKKVIDDGGK